VAAPFIRVRVFGVLGLWVLQGPGMEWKSRRRD